MADNDYNGSGFSERQYRALQAMIQGAANAGPPGPPGPPGPSGPAGVDGETGAGHRNGVERWNPSDLGFFDPFYDGKSADTGQAMEHAGKDTYFRDIHAFLDRIKDMARVKGAEKVRQNLQLSLRGTALEWYTSELTDGEKRLVSYGDETQEWCTLLLGRFKAPPSIGMATLLKASYNLYDAYKQREPRSFAQEVIRGAKIAQLGNVFNQLTIIRNGLDLEFRRDIPEPTEATTLNSFLQELDRHKHEWWQYATRHYRGSTVSNTNQNRGFSRNGSARNDARFGGQGQYPRSPNFPFRPRNQGYSDSQTSTPTQNRAYNYQQRPSYSQGFRNPSSSESDRTSLALPPARRPLMIMAPNSQNQSAGRSDQSNMSDSPNKTFGDRRQYRPSRSQKAYQANVIDENNEDSQQENTGSYHGATAIWEDGLQEAYDQGISDAFQGYDDTGQYAETENHDLGTDVNFINPPNELCHPCSNCGIRFHSRTKLFRHLRQDCWTKTDCDKRKEGTTVVRPSVPDIPESSSLVDIIASKAPKVDNTGYSFRSWHYATTQVSFKPSAPEFDVCLDAGCTMTLIDRAFAMEHIPNLSIRTMPSPIPVRGIGTKVHKSGEFAVVDIFIKGKRHDNGKLAMAKMTREVHFMDELKANMLIGTDILTPEAMKLDFENQKVDIGSCNIRAKINSFARETPNVKRTIRSKGRTVVPPHALVQIPVQFNDQLPEDRDFLFKPQFKDELGHSGGIYAHVVDSTLSFVQLKNSTDYPVIIQRRKRLGSVVEYTQQGAFLAATEDAHLASTGWKSGRPGKSTWKRSMYAGLAMAATTMAGIATRDAAAKLNINDIAITGITGAAATRLPGITTTGNDDRFKNENPDMFSNCDVTCNFNNSASPISGAAAAPVQVDPRLENVMENGLTVYGSEDDATVIAELAQGYNDIFTDQGSTVLMPESSWMPIDLKPGAIPKAAKVYPLSGKDKNEVDKVFNKLHAQGKMEYSANPTPFGYPVFVVWKNTPNGRKGRVVVDIRGLNTITLPDSYPMPLQTDITGTSTLIRLKAFNFFLLSLCYISFANNLNSDLII